MTSLVESAIEIGEHDLSTFLNPLSPKGDQHKISPYHIYAFPSKFKKHDHTR